MENKQTNKNLRRLRSSLFAYLFPCIVSVFIPGERKVKGEKEKKNKQR